ncbi:MAG: alpha/beta fold hydrolase [Bacteroidales bacterium]|nr:alpha/beta fold hydrolase [Bacteroidales bacterium]
MQLFYRKFGQGKPLIILHGLFGISDNWVSFAKKIAELGYEVFIPDQRNHGQSPHSPAFNYLALVDDLFEFIDEHELEDASILGHSMGGKVAMRFALENPHYLSKLIVVDISLRAYQARPHHKNVIKAMKNVDFSIIKSRKEVEDILQQNIADPRIRLFVMKNLHRVSQHEFEWRLYLDGINDNLDQMFDGIEVPDAFEKPSLFIRGGASDYVMDQDIEPINQAFPNNKLYTIPNATHWVHAEAPALFYQYVSEFLKQ